mgnify:CR=1 FL=1
MALSPQVQESLTNAQSELRNALWHAARNEKAQTISQIAELLTAVDKVAAVNDILEHLQKMKDKNQLDWTDFD